MVKTVFAKIVKSYLKRLDLCANFLNYCVNLPRNTCTHSKPHTKSTHIEKNYTMTQCLVSFLHKRKTSSDNFYLSIKFHQTTHTHTYTYTHTHTHTHTHTSSSSTFSTHLNIHECLYYLQETRKYL